MPGAVSLHRSNPSPADGRVSVMPDTNPSDRRGVDDILRSAQRMMTMARSGQADYLEGRDRSVLGLYQSVTSGRSVTFVLQNLRGKVEGFDEWYDRMQALLKA